MNVMRVINEPTAACIAYELDKKAPDAEIYVLVFDYGGSNLELTLMLIEDGIFDLRVTHTEENVGGDAIDNLLVDYCIKQFQKTSGIDITKNARAVSRLRR